MNSAGVRDGSTIRTGTGSCLDTIFSGSAAARKKNDELFADDASASKAAATQAKLESRRAQRERKHLPTK